MLAVMVECAFGTGAIGHLHLNEYAPTRARLPTKLFPGAVVTAFNAEVIADRLHDVRPTVVLMNPPSSATPGVDRIRHDADLRHVRSAFSMLPPGGRLVTIVSGNCVPGDAAWTDAFARLDPPARCMFTMAIDGRAYARRGTGFDTRLTVLERSAEAGIEVDREARAANAGELLDAVIARLPIAPMPVSAGPACDLFGKAVASAPPKRRTGTHAAAPQTSQTQDWGPVAKLAVEIGPVERAATDAVAANNTGPYARWRPGAVRVPGAVDHLRTLAARRLTYRNNTVAPPPAAIHIAGRAAAGTRRTPRRDPMIAQTLPDNPNYCVNGGVKMYRRGGVKMYCGLGGSLSP